MKTTVFFLILFYMFSFISAVGAGTEWAILISLNCMLTLGIIIVKKSTGVYEEEVEEEIEEQVKEQIMEPVAQPVMEPVMESDFIPGQSLSPVSTSFAADFLKVTSPSFFK